MYSQPFCCFGRASPRRGALARRVVQPGFSFRALLRRTPCYSNATLRKGEEAQEIFQFIAFWKRTHGELPHHLVFDSKLTTQQGLARLDQMGIPFITLRLTTFNGSAKRPKT